MPRDFLNVNIICICNSNLLSMVSLGIWARPKEIRDLLNSWPKILSCVQKVTGQSVPSPFDSASTSLKVFAVNVVVQGVAFAAAVVVIFKNLPIFS